MVDKHFTVQMVEFMLHHTCQITFHFFFMLHKILVHIFHTNFISSFHGLMNTGKTQATFFHTHFLTSYFQNMRINISFIKTFKFRIIF